MTNKVSYLDGPGQVIAELQVLYHCGELSGIIAVAKTADGGSICIASDELPYIEKLGLLEAAKIDLVVLSAGE